MLRNLAFFVLLPFLASCGPPLVWGGDEATKERLLAIVPVGSSVQRLQSEATAREWRVSFHDERTFKDGLVHDFGDGCAFKGGISTNIIVAEYGVLTTSVETKWMFNAAGKLADLCIRRTTDAP